MNAKGRGTALVLATAALIVSFTAWGGLAPLAPLFRELYGLTTTQVGLLVAAPVLVGALGRIPLGLLADRFGGRVVFTALLVATLGPVALVALTGSWLTLLGAGLLLGLAGTSFAVGIPFVVQWFPPSGVDSPSESTEWGTWGRQWPASLRRTSPTRWGGARTSGCSCR